MKQAFHFQDIEIHYLLQRTRRRSIGISVKPSTEVMVRVPHSAKFEQIHSVLKKRASWILEKQGYFRELKNRFPEKEFVSGESLPFLGRNLRLKIKIGTSNKINCYLEGDRLVVERRDGDFETKKTRSLLLNWYRLQAMQFFAARVVQFTQRTGMRPKNIYLKDAKTKWGSCSARGNLNFNWRLMMMPRPIIDYVVVHELCHLQFPNHKKEFWNKVGTILPNFGERRTWLKNHSYEYLNYFRDPSG